MKTKYPIIILLLLMLFTSCVIREAEPKPDFTKTGYQILRASESGIFELITLFDNSLKINNYINTPDSLKEVTKKKFFVTTQIKYEKPNKWNLTQNNFDTISTIVSDSISLNKIGAIWFVKERKADDYCKIECIANNKWKIIALKTTIYGLTENANLIFECTDGKNPMSFKTSNFIITGSGDLTSIFQEEQNVYLTYSIKDKLMNDTTYSRIISGSMDLTAKDLETNQSSTATATYSKQNGGKASLIIDSNGYTNTYDNWSGYFIYY
ncbi:MAG: hypothetical protein ACOYMD_05375 [Paludibacter sp.]